MRSLNDQLTSMTESLAFLLPEFVLSAGILLVLLAGLFPVRRNIFFSSLAAVAALVSAVLILGEASAAETSLFDGLLKREALGNFLMVLVDVSVLLTCAMSVKKKNKPHLSEYYALLLSVALGGHLMLMTTNFLVVFLSLEIVSISSYVLAGYSFTKSGTEGSLKYFLFGAIASATMLYGFSLLYGVAGTLDFSSRAFFDALVASPSPLLLIGGLMGLGGFLFKISAAPMHPWAPDVYEAAPIPVIAFLSVAPKMAGLGILTKYVLAMHLFGQSDYDWQILITVISLLTITIGNLSAIWQRNPKRMMAYSSIAHSGFLLVGLAAFLPEGIHFMLFYATVYLLMNYAVFCYLAFFEELGINSMDTFAGTGRKYIWPATGLTIGLIALTGLPPTAGFTAKLLIFSGLWESYETSGKLLLLWLLVFGLLNTVISLFYYLRIPYYAFLKAGFDNGIEKKFTAENFLGLILVVLVVIIFFLPGLLMGLINRINFVL